MNYTTQMDAAREGNPDGRSFWRLPKKSRWNQKLVKLVAAGQVVIPANKCHTCLDSKRNRLRTPHKNQRQPRNLPRFKRP